MAAKVRPFEINVPDQLLADLKSKLSLARFPEQLQDVDWQGEESLAYQF